MENQIYEDYEYLRFVVETSQKVNEIAREYNKLSEKNKYRVNMELKTTYLVKGLFGRW